MLKLHPNWSPSFSLGSFAVFTILTVMLLLFSVDNARAATTVDSPGNTSTDFDDGAKPGNIQLVNPQSGQPVPYEAAKENGLVGPNFSASWTHSFGAITDATNAGSITNALAAQDSASAGNELDSFVVDGTDSTNRLNTEPVGATILLNDTFDRPDNTVVGEDWVEVEEAGASVAIANQKLFFDDTSDVASRPLAKRTFTQVSTGTLQWDFDFDWDRTGDESTYRFMMQLGDSAELSDDSHNGGAGVNLVWTDINRAHQSLGYSRGGVDTALAVVSGSAAIGVVADLDAQTYSVAVDGAVLESGIPFDANVSLDTVRFFTDKLSETKVSGRTIDNVIIIIPDIRPLEAEPSFALVNDPSDGATGFKVGITRVFDPSTNDDVPVSLGSFQAQLTYQDPSSNPSFPPGSRCVNILEVREMEIPINSHIIDDMAGVAMFDGSHVSGVSAPTDLGLALTRLTGSAHQQCQVRSELTSLREVDSNPISVSPFLTQTVQRGDAKADGIVTVADALFIAQHLAGSRPACTSIMDTSCLHSVNAASVRHDGAFDEQNIADAQFIAEYLLGLRDEFYNSSGVGSPIDH